MSGFRRSTLRRMARRVEALKRHFVWSLRAFERDSRFVGPSQYFHLRTLERRRQHPSVVDAFHDPDYCDALYATLTAWGLHRMGPGNAKLLDLATIRRSLINNADRIRALEGHRLSTLRVH